MFVQGLKYGKGKTLHSRKGFVQHRFSYDIDLLAVSFKVTKELTKHQNIALCGPLVKLDLRAFDLAAIHKTALELNSDNVVLYTQPKILGKVFNPVSFFFLRRGREILAMIADVNSTFGENKMYFASNSDNTLYGENGVLVDKEMRVSPFQKTTGHYRFALDGNIFQNFRVIVDYTNPDNNHHAGVFTDLRIERLDKLTGAVKFGCFIRSPIGSLRTLARIHWQALRLWKKKAIFVRS